MTEFCNVENMKLCLSVFDKYMNDRYNINVKTLRDTDVKKELYKIMIRLMSNPDFNENTLKSMNNIAINEVKNLYVEKYKIIENKKIHVKTIDRENTLYGDRELLSNSIMPEITNLKNEKGNTYIDFELMQKDRGYDEDKSEPIAIANKITSETIDSISSEELTKKLKAHQESRNIIFTNDVTEDPKVLFTKKLDILNDLNDNSNNIRNNIVDNIDNSKNGYVNYSKELVIEKPTLKLKTNYISISGYDRDIVQYPNRYSFAVDFNKLSKKYKNVHKLSFTNLIIPAKVDDVNASGISGLDAPYLNLCIQEFSDLYDGFGDSVKHCFTQFIYDKSYKTVNGRGYVTMKPCQSEEKVFVPMLSYIQKLNISINTPIGSIFNNSTDTNSILKIEYETYNSTLLKVVTTKFFDKNDFYTGDVVLLDGFKMPHDIPSSDYGENRSTYNKIMEFINKKDGHEIIEIGKSNENGFYRSFFIRVMLTFDENCGKMVADKEMLDLITLYNSNYTYDSIIENGTIVNTSLQFNLTCKIEIGDY